MTERIASKDLTPALRRQIARGGAAGPKTATTKVAIRGDWTCVCTKCGHTPTSDADATKHTAATGHSRWEHLTTIG